MDQTVGLQNSVNIICLYWVGDFRGRDFVEDDVTRLRNSVDKHIDQPYEFYCLTNKMGANIPAKKIRLKHDWPGWWGKMELHRPDLPLGRTLYLDLDSHVIRSLKPILDFEGNLVMFPSRMSKKTINRPGVVHRYQAATMLFDPGSTAGFYKMFLEKPDFYMSRFRSEQDLMGVYLPKQPTFPDEWMEKLSKCRKKTGPPKDAIIVTGQPSGHYFRLFPKMIPWLEEMARG